MTVEGYSEDDLRQSLNQAYVGWLQTQLIPLDAGMTIIAIWDVHPEDVSDCFSKGFTVDELVSLILAEVDLRDAGQNVQVMFEEPGYYPPLLTDETIEEMNTRRIKKIREIKYK